MPKRLLPMGALAYVVASIVLGCTPGDENPPVDGKGRGNGPGDGAIDPNAPPPPSDNIIDVAIWPRLVRDGLTGLVPASNGELCRRTSLDLIGVLPTREERASKCTGKSAREMARAFMADDRFALRQMRLWVQRLKEDPMMVSAYHMLHADEILRDYAKGAIGYDDFAARLAAHPITVVNRPKVPDDRKDIPRTLFPLFLGRIPSIPEAVDFADLYRPWAREALGDPSGVVGYRPETAAIDPDRCQNAVTGESTCAASLFGQRTVIKLPPNPSGAGCFNYFNLGDKGGVVGPADGFMCYRRIPDVAPYGYTDGTGLPAANIQTELEKPGRLLATRDEFWENAADLALSDLLGWWKSTANEPESVVPEVRTALGKWFRSVPGHDMRVLYEMIASSILYASTADVSADVAQNVDNIAFWSRGPMRAMTAEQYLDSAIHVLNRQGTGEENGPCDPHVSSDSLLYTYYFPRALRMPSDTTTDAFYRSAADKLGGCLGGSPSAITPGLGALFAQVGIGQKICDDKSDLVPAGLSTTAPTTTADIDRVIDAQWDTLLVRPPSAEEKSAAAELGATCRANNSCTTLGAYAKTLCQTILRSSAFIHY
jgi:hypothetical protein